MNLSVSNPLSPVKSSKNSAAGASPLQPALYAAVALGLGIALGQHAWRPPAWFIAGGATLIAASCFFVRRRLRLSFAFSFAALILLGMVDIQLRGSTHRLPDLTPFAEDHPVTVTGYVIREGLAHDVSSAELREGNPASWEYKTDNSPGGGLEQQQTIDLQTVEIEQDGAATPISAGIRAHIYSRLRPAGEIAGASQLLQLRYGERMRFRAKLRLPRNFGDPGALDYQGYLRNHGIFALTALKAEEIERLPGTEGSWYGRWRSDFRRSLFAKIDSLWSPRDASLLKAVLVGERSLIDRGTRMNFQSTGSYHLLVVSGLYVSIFAYVIFWVARGLRLGRVPATVITIGLVFVYAYLSEMGSPVIRAFMMLCIYLVTRLLHRDRAVLNAIGVASLIILVAEPQALFEAGFQMTFLAVVAIAGIALPILERSSQPYRRALSSLDARDYDIKFPPSLAQFRLDMRLIVERLAAVIGSKASSRAAPGAVKGMLWAYEIFIVAAIMQLAMALPTAFYFHRAAFLGMLANAIVVPMAGVLLPVTVCTLLLAYVWPPLASLPALMSRLALHVVSATVHYLGGLHFAEVRVADPPAVVVWLAAAGVVTALLLVRRRPVVATAGIVFLVATALMLAFPWKAQLRPRAMEVTAIDVGQGDSILVVSPEGRTLLIDGGGPTGPVHSEFDFGEDVVSPYLWQRGISRLDAVALTHAHSDHIGGLGSVVANFRPRELWLGPNPQTHALASLVLQAAEQNTAIVHRSTGENFNFGGANVRVLSPPSGWEVKALPRNDDSLAMLFRFGNTTALLAGDAEKKSESSMALESPHADLLKIAHHGSGTSTTQLFLEAVHPRYAVISAGFRNSFGHPKLQVLERLDEARVITYRTDIDGAVTFYLDGNLVTATLPNRPPGLLRIFLWQRIERRQ